MSFIFSRPPEPEPLPPLPEPPKIDENESRLRYRGKGLYSRIFTSPLGIQQNVGNDKTLLGE